MPPSLALLTWLILLAALLYFDPAKDKVSAALWVPLTWVFIIGSRLPSQWLGRTGTSGTYQEGDILDRSIFSILILLAMGILLWRSFKWSSLFRENLALMAFLFFALVSIVWSDFPFVALKRWVRDLGNYLVILVVLTDPHPMDAVRTFLRRFSYLLIPLSVVLIKYFPGIGRGYDEWTGAPGYSGVTTSKDMLGIVCLISGLFFLWDTLTRWPDRRNWRTKKIIVLNFVFISWTLWLSNLADCATCKVCLLLGCAVIAAAHSKSVGRHPGPFKFLIPLTVCLCYLFLFVIDMKAVIGEAVGRDATFTGRTLVWSDLLNVKINPVLGTGYESFWLGPRLIQMWSKWAFHPNQAHNGFLEVYLNLGVIGLFFMVLLLIASYRTICRRLAPFSNLASLSVAVWTVLIIDNATSASFGKGDVLWITFLLFAIAVPQRMEGRMATTMASKNRATEQFLRLSSETQVNAGN